METKVADSRVVEDGKCIRRRRSCEYCGHRFTTYERIAVTDLIIIKRDGTREMYDRGKLSKALIIAFGKKDFSLEKIDDIILKLESKRSGMGKEIASTKI
jgi:transcriptional repressor NrdR